MITGEMNTEEQNRELLWNLMRDGLLLVSPFALWAYDWIDRRREKNRESEDGSCSVCNTHPAVITVVMNPCACTMCYWCSERGRGKCTICGCNVEGKRVMRGTAVKSSEHT